MAVTLNLLPTGVGVTGKLGKTLKITRMLGVISVALFLIFTLGVSAFFVFSTISLRNINSDINSLKSQILALQSTEQQTFLLKDRVGKIKTALNSPSAAQNIASANSTIAALPPSAGLEELTIDAQKIDLSVQLSSTADLTSFLRILSDSKVFKSGVMTNFNFSPSKGYSVTVQLSAK